jgi:WD40 repeat protein
VINTGSSTATICALTVLDNGHIVSGTNIGLLKSYDSANNLNTLLFTDVTHSPIISIVDLGNNQMAVASLNYIVRIFDPNSYHIPLNVINQASYGFINSMIKLSNENLLATGNSDGVIKVWDISQSTSEPKAQISIGSSVNALIQLPNENFVSAGNDGTIRVWNVTSSTQQPVQTIYTTRINSLLLLSNSNVASGHNDGHVRVWNLLSKTAHFPVTVFSGTSPINSLSTFY